MDRERTADQLKIAKSVQGGCTSATCLNTFGDLGWLEVFYATIPRVTKCIGHHTS
jgi:hypothetical protein